MNDGMSFAKHCGRGEMNSRPRMVKTTTRLKEMDSHSIGNGLTKTVMKEPTASMFTGSSGSISGTCAPTPVPTTSPAPAPTAAKASDDGPDDGTLQEIGDAVVDYWSATKNLLKDIWGAFF